MEKKDKIKVGFIGCGQISALHQLGYVNNPDAELVAICNRGKSVLEKTAANWGVQKTYMDYRELLNDKEIDMVEILTPHSSHMEIAIAAAQAGKHISLQKVPTITLAQYDKIIEAVKKAKVKFRVYENFRFHPPYQKAMELIKSGAIGKVENVNQRMWVGLDKYSLAKEFVHLKTWLWRIKEKENYGIPTVFDDGYHKHSLARLFLGKKITSVFTWSNYAKLGGVLKIDSPTLVIYRTEDPYCYGTWNTSIIPSLHIPSDYYSSDEFIEITGTKGMMFINGCTGNMFIGDKNSPEKPGVYWKDGKGKWHSETRIHTNWKWSFIECTRNFIQAIKNNTEAELTAAEGREILKLTLAIVKSMKHEGKEVKISEVGRGVIR